MAQVPTRDTLADLERHRLRLEDSLEKLRKALRHWQTWEAEYEGLKEEFQALPAQATAAELLKTAQSFGGDLVSEKEVKELLGVDKGIERSNAKVVELVSRRIDYVHRNVESLQKQFDAAQMKLDSIEIVANPEARNEEGLPIRDIYEELDDDGNVIASRISNPDDAEPHILKALQKAGLKGQDIGLDEPSVVRASTKDSDEFTSRSEPEQSPLSKPPPPSTSPTTSRAPGNLTQPQSTQKKKSVSIANDAKPASSATSRSVSEPHQPKDLSELVKGSFASSDRVIELDEDDKQIASTIPTAPIDESPEDAALRRQMQAYSMREVGEIVAQLDLEGEESASQSSYDEEEGDEQDDDMEDQYGMNAEGQLTEEYRQEMLALEQKLNARMIQNLGPNPILSGDSELAVDARKLVVQRDNPQAEENDAKTERTKPQGKAVRFAENLDIAPTAETVVSDAVQPETGPNSSVIKDTVIERNVPAQSTEGQQRPVSRFKMARQDAKAAQNAQDMANAGVTSRSPLASTVVERSAATPTEPPDEFDVNIVRQEVNSEYYRQRNRIIQRQGGFKRNQGVLLDDGDDESGNAGDEAEETPRKVSLFKAARTQRGGSW